MINWFFIIGAVLLAIASFFSYVKTAYLSNIAMEIIEAAVKGNEEKIFNKVAELVSSQIKAVEVSDKEIEELKKSPEFEEFKKEIERMMEEEKNKLN